MTPPLTNTFCSAFLIIINRLSASAGLGTVFNNSGTGAIEVHGGTLVLPNYVASVQSVTIGIGSGGAGQAGQLPGRRRQGNFVRAGCRRGAHGVNRPTAPDGRLVFSKAWPASAFGFKPVVQNTLPVQGGSGQRDKSSGKAFPATQNAPTQSRRVFHAKAVAATGFKCPVRPQSCCPGPARRRAGASFWPRLH